MSKLFLFLFSLSAMAAAPDLELSVKKGKAPLLVKLTGPEVLLKKARACEKVWGSVGFSVDWGDGSPRHMGGGEPNCAELLQHTYTVPGKYSVQVAVFHPGPTDAPVFDYQGTSTIEVGGGSGAATQSVKLFLGKEDLVPVYYGAGLSPLRFQVETTIPLKLKAEILKDDGAVLFSETASASFTGTNSIRWAKYGNGPDASQYKEGKVFARYRITATNAEGKVVAQDESPRFTIYAKVMFRSFDLTPAKGKAPLEVVASVSFHHAECASYIVDWGDGSADEAGGTFSGKKSCPLTPYPVSLKHTYKKRGQYLVRWYDNSGNPFEPAVKAPGYMEKQVKVD